MISVKLFNRPETLETDIAEWVLGLDGPQLLSFAVVGLGVQILVVAQSLTANALVQADITAAALLAAQTLLAAGPTQSLPPASTIVTDNGDVWTLGPLGEVLQNGNQAAGGVGSRILFLQHHLYVLGTDANWWLWTGAGWTNVGAIQPGL